MTIAPMPPPQPWQDEQGQWQLDLRGLPPPQPFVSIVRLLGQLGAEASTVHALFDRDPLPLYAELAERGWVAERNAADGGGVCLTLTRARAG